MIPSSLRLATSLCAATYLCACATYGTVAEPVPLGNGVYSIGAETGQRAGSAMHSETYRRATRFCFEQGKQLLRLDGQSGLPPQAAGMQFRCVGPDEPGWKEPVG